MQPLLWDTSTENQAMSLQDKCWFLGQIWIWMSLMEAVVFRESLQRHFTYTYLFFYHFLFHLLCCVYFIPASNGFVNLCCISILNPSTCDFYFHSKAYVFSLDILIWPWFLMPMFHKVVVCLEVGLGRLRGASSTKLAGAGMGVSACLHTKSQSLETHALAMPSWLMGIGIMNNMYFCL